MKRENLSKMELKNKKALGIDIGGTQSKIGIVQYGGKILDSFTVNQAPNISPKELFGKISKEINERKWTFNAAGVSIAGTVEQSSGKLIFSPNLYWKNINIKKYLQDFTGKKVIIENDANSAAWGAYCVEFKTKIKDLVCITLGTGVGSGLIFGGKIYRGSYGSAGELGHMTIDPLGKNCNCGNRGCLETFVGANYLTQNAQIKMGEKFTPVELHTLAKKGNKPAIEIFKEMGKYLGIAVANVVNLLNPKIVLFTGGLAGNKEFFIDDVILTVRKRAMWPNSCQTKILVSKMAQGMGIIGAACLALYPAND